jgi:predicted nucleic acid-binding protein
MKDSDEKHERVVKFIKNCPNDSEVEFVTSDFTFTEVAKVLIRNKNKSATRVYKIISDLSRTQQIAEIKFKMIKPHGDYPSFFIGIQEELLENKKLSIADAIHVTIMRDNKIRVILTFDKKDYMKVRKINALLPRELLENIARRLEISKKLND